MAEEVAVELRLPVLVEAEGVVELRDGLLRHERLQKADDRGRVLDVDVEVGAREAEDDRDLVLVAEDGVDLDAPRPVHEREDDGPLPSVAADPPDDVGPLAPEEDGLEEVQRVESGRSPGLAEGALESAGREGRVAREVLPPGGEGMRGERAPHGGLAARAAVERGEEAAGGLHGERRGVEMDELDAVVDADGVEDAARGRVEERLDELGVAARGGEPHEALLHSGPDAGVVDSRAEDPAEVLDGGVERPAVELEALERVPPAGVPVPPREPDRCAARDRGERPRVRLPAGEEALGAGADGVVRGHGRGAALRRPSSAPRRRSSGCRRRGVRPPPRTSRRRDA